MRVLVSYVLLGAYRIHVHVLQMLGHGLHRDTLKQQLMTFVEMLVIGTLAWLTLRTPALFTAFGFEGVNYGFAVILIMSDSAMTRPLDDSMFSIILSR